MQDGRRPPGGPSYDALEVEFDEFRRVTVRTSGEGCQAASSRSMRGVVDGDPAVKKALSWMAWLACRP